MTRFKALFMMAGLVVVMATVVVTALAQPPAGGRGGRGGRGGFGGQGGAGGPGGQGAPGGGGGRGANRGGGAGGMFGGGMFGGGMFGGLLTLAQNGEVQSEIKMTDRQKEAVKKISDDQGPKRQRVFDQLKNQTQRFQRQAEQQAQFQAQAEIAAQANGNNDPRVFGNGSQELADAANGRGFQGRDLGQPGVDPALAQQAVQQRAREAGNMAQAQSRQMMGEAMQMLQRDSERDLAKVLDKTQIKRLREIQLQSQGASAVLQPEVADKLQISEEQHEEIQAALAQAGQVRRELMTKNFQMFRNMRPGGPGGGPPDANATPAGGGNDQGGQPAGGQGGQNGQGRRGQRGGQGGQNGPRFDPEAMRKFMERPEVKAQMEETRKAQDQLREREYAMVYKAMDRRQVSNFKKMLGKPFDVNLLMPGPFRGGQRGNANNTDAATKTAAKTETAKTEAGKTEPEAPASKPSNNNRRPSLRERRGLGQQSSPN